jgi:hypothetical protein
MKKMVLILTALGLTACPPQKPEDTTRDVARSNAKDRSEPVASIEGQPLTLAEFERRISHVPVSARSRFGSVEARKAFLEAQVQFEVLALRAEREGLGSSSLTRDEMKEALAGELIDEALRKNVRAADIGQESIQAYYEAHKAEFSKAVRRDVVAIFQDSEKDANVLRDSLSAIEYVGDKQRIYTFRTFADRNTIFVDQRKKGGAIGELADPQALQAPQVISGRYSSLAAPAFALEKPGDFSPVIAFEKYFVFLTYLSEKPAEVQELSSVEDEIRQTLHEQARVAALEAFEADVLGKAQVDVNEAAIKLIKAPVAEDPMSREALDAFGAALGYDTREAR